MVVISLMENFTLLPSSHNVASAASTSHCAASLRLRLESEEQQELVLEGWGVEEVQNYNQSGVPTAQACARTTWKQPGVE